MRTLLLLRHAKSDWTDPGLDDHDRPLAPRGIRACPLIGEHVRRMGATPGLVVSSSAVRALDTARRTSAAWTPAPPIEVDEGLYLSDTGRMLARVRETPAEVQALMVVAHHPGIPDLSRKLSQGLEDGAGKSLAGKFPTAGLAVIRFGTDAWSGIAPGSGSLEAFVRPKDLERSGKPAPV